MTLLPSSDFGIRGHEGKAYGVQEVCAHPQCGLRSQHAHHLWPRSYLRGQPYEWVSIPLILWYADEDAEKDKPMIVGNRVGLCVEHHNQVTGEIGGYRAKISFTAGIFYWHNRALPDDQTVRNPLVDEWILVGPLTYQPPGAKQHDATHATLPKGEQCPTCGHRKPLRTAKPSTRRKTKQWALVVPDDAEIGADVLDGWADDLAEILGFGDQASRLRRYHAVATALAWVTQNRQQFVADLIEAQA